MDGEMMSMDEQRPYEEEEYYAPARRIPPRGMVEPYYGGSFRAEMIDLKNKILLFLGCIAVGALIWAMIILFWVRVLAVVVACLLLLLGLAYVIIAFLKWVHKGQVIRAGTTGAYKEDWRGKMVPIAPLNPVTPKQAARANTIIDVKIPKLADVLDSLTEGVNELIGYRENGVADYAEGPRGTVAIIGSGESGKSVTTLIRILIALFQGKDVTVCDPHRFKARSLYNKISPLEPWITFAFTEAEIKQAAENFSHELQERKANRGDGRAKLIVYDEFKSIVKQSKDPDVSKAVVKSVEQASDEGMGFDLGTIVVCHGVKEDAIGDVAVREAFKAVFCHNIDPAQSDIVLQDKRFSKKSNKLHKGHLYYRNEYGEIDYRIMPYGDIEDAKTAARMLERMGIPKKHERIMPDAAQNAEIGSRELAPFNQRAIRQEYPDEVARLLTELGMYSPYSAPTVPTGMPDLPMKTPIVHEDEDDFVSDEWKRVSTEETALQASSHIIDGVFPESKNDANVRIKDLTCAVSADIRGIIKRMRKRDIAFRDIAAYVGLSGRNYHVFQEVCREEGLLPASEEGA